MTTFSAPPHHTRGRDHGGNKNKMLASTMQFPNNNPHHTSAPPHTGHRSSMAGTRPQARNNHPLTRAAGPVVPGPNSVPTPPRPSEPGDSSFHTPARYPGQHPEHPFQAQYYKDHRPVRPGALFVDVPPMSNPPIHTRDRHGHLMDHPDNPRTWCGTRWPCAP